MICLILNWFFYDPSRMLNFIRSSVQIDFKNFILSQQIEAIKKGLFSAVSLTRFHFSRTLPLKKEYDRFTTVPFKPFPDQRWLIFLIFYLKIDYFKFGFSVQMTYSLAELWRNSLATFLWRADWNFVFST